MTTPNTQPNDATVLERMIKHLYPYIALESAASMLLRNLNTAQEVCERNGVTLTGAIVMAVETISGMRNTKAASGKNRVLNTLKECGEMSAKTIGEILSMNKAYTHQMLTELSEQGLVVRKQLKTVAGKPYVYELSPASEAILIKDPAERTPKAQAAISKTLNDMCHFLTSLPCNSGVSAEQLYLAALGGERETLDACIARFELAIQDEVERTIELMQSTGGTDL